MKDFLHYSHLMSSKTDSGRVFFYEKEDEGSCSYDQNDQNHIVFAEYNDSSECKESNWLISVEINNAVTEFTGYGSDDEAKKFVQSEWENFEKKIHPKGIHVVNSAIKNAVDAAKATGDTDALKEAFKELVSHWNRGWMYEYQGIYLGNMRLATVMSKKGKVFEVRASKYHANKFYDLDCKKDFSSAGDALNHALSALDIERYETDKKVAMEKKLEDAQAESDFLGLPALIGSEKQCQWGEKIRSEFLSNASPAQLAKLKKLKSPAKAKFWIDNRSNIDAKIKG